MIAVRVQEGDIDVARELVRLDAAGGGAVASFTGIVRGEGGLEALVLEQYPGMTQATLAAIAREAADRWSLAAVVLVHRHGTLAAGERIIFVGTASRHRAAALEACAFLIDRAKTVAPFWKQERFADGRRNWVEPREIDMAAAARW